MDRVGSRARDVLLALVFKKNRAPGSHGLALVRVEQIASHIVTASVEWPLRFDLGVVDPFVHNARRALGRQTGWGQKE